MMYYGMKFVRKLELPIDSYEIKLKIAEAKENYDGMGVRNHD